LYFIILTLPQERQKGREEEEKGVSSYWIAVRKEDTGN
jgi:hypothetical protein